MVLVGGGGSLDGLRDDAPSSVSHHSPTGVDGASALRSAEARAGGRLETRRRTQ